MLSSCKVHIFVFAMILPNEWGFEAQCDRVGESFVLLLALHLIPNS